MNGEGKSVAVRTSPIHGSGLFAVRSIAPGEPIAPYRGERISKEESRRRSAARPEGAPVYVVALDDGTDIDGDVPDNPAMYANHGCEANAALEASGDGLRLVATREIAPGEEILFDYGFGLAESLGRPCRCGSSRCTGRIVAEPLRPLLKKLLRPKTIR